MEKDNSKFHTLLGKFANRSASAEESGTLRLMLEQANDRTVNLDDFAKLNAEFDGLRSYINFEVNHAWGNVEDQFKVKTRKLSFNRLSAVAAIFLVLVVALVAYGSFGTSTAASFATTETSQYLLLDDLTEVKLGSDSNLKTLGLRNVALEGDAFFHVAKQESTDFKIHTKFATLKVLGTSFKIDQSETSMIIQMREGRLEIESIHDSKEIHVIEGTELAIINEEGIEIQEGSSDNLLDDFIFNNASIESVIKDINGSFNNLIDTNFEKVDEACLLTANFNNLSLLEIIEELNLLFELDYKLQNGRVQISALTCH